MTPDMYAIVKSGGKQYRVERGQRLLVERLPADEGSEVPLEPILYRDDDAVFDRDGLASVKVTARVVGHVRGEKLRVFKFKPKRGYRRRTGHRQELTQIEVLEIAVGAKRAAKARSKAATEQDGDTAERPTKARAKAAAEQAGGSARPAKARAKAADEQGGDAGKPPAKPARESRTKKQEAEDGS
jgi:large subunit ribosomal protein L21